MNQIPLSPIANDFELSSKRTRKRVFLEEMNVVVPWAALIKLIEPHYPKGTTGRPVTGIDTMLRVHFMQQWFGLSDPAMEEALHDVAIYRQFITTPAGTVTIPDETTILRFRHLLEKHQIAPQILATVNALLAMQGLFLKQGTAIDATLIPAPVSTKNKDKARDPEMHSSKKGNQWHFGMKAHIGIDTGSGLVHTVTATSGNAHDVTQAANLLHGQEHSVHGDAGYQGMGEREDFKTKHPQLKPTQLFISMRRGKRKKLDPSTAIGQLLEAAEKAMAKIRAFVEHPFRVIKRQFGYTKVRYRGLAKNAAQQTTLFALSNLWMVRGKLMAC
jgi:transposase, IS5 family